MVMRKLYKEFFVSIRKSFKRFLSITLIVLLGVGFFAGIRATSPDMKDTLSRYYKKNNMYDIELMSNYGISQDDISKIRDKGYDIEGSISFDVVVNNDDSLYAVKVMSYDKNNDINKLVLLEGKMPSNSDECVIERNDYTEDYKIGDSIYLDSDDVKNKELKIVGLVKSPLYISDERGSTNLLTGKINYYLYTDISNFNTDVYTEAYIDIDSDNDIFDSKYEDEVDGYEKKLEDVTDTIGNSNYEEIVKQYEDGIDEATSLYEENLDRYNDIKDVTYIDSTVKDTMKDELDSAKVKIDDLKKELDELDKVEWYVLDLSSNAGYYSYDADTERIANIAKVFPIVFFVVAILICLTTMTRMVEEERIQIGTLKSLGYDDISISFKYVLYAVLATVIGSLVGVVIGFNIIPNIIFNMYKIMYNVDGFVSSFYWGLTLQGMVIALICTVGATIYACAKTLKEVPASLLRPKAPTVGKRVWLEYIPFIWKRLKFSSKVTVRNVFRYKKRMFMTILGIAGCTGLILAGFGLKDCITNLVPNQYEKIFNYQVEVTLNDNLNVDELDSVYEQVNELDEVNKALKVEKESIEIKNKDTNQSITLVVPFSDTSDFIKLQDRKSGKKFDLGSGAIVTEKISNLLDINEGDNLVLDGKKDYKVVVSDITENYLYHYIYISRDVYDSDSYNTILVKTDEMSVKEEQEFSNKLKDIDGVSSMSFTSSTEDMFDSTMKNFSYVSLVLIVSAGMLAFIVLYNLASINISERNREMATIKVLGFYDKEVYNYIGRESNILTIIGIAFGMGIGVVLTRFIIKTCEIDILMFDSNIKAISYVYAILITLIFTIVVNIVTYFSLKKIDMISSLKSAE